MLLRRVAVAVLVLAGMPVAMNAATAEVHSGTTEADAQLRHADSIKSSDNGAFVALLDQIERQPARLNERQREMLAYLRGWEFAYRSDFAAAVSALTTLADGASDPTVRLRANVTLVNVLEISRRFEPAYARMQQVIEALPNAEPEARQQAIGVASEMYISAGQFDLGIHYANQLLVQASDPHVICKGLTHRLQGYYQASGYADFLGSLQAGVDACTKAREPIYANMIRVNAAHIYLALKRPGDALALLARHRDEAQATHYGELTSNFDAVLAKSHLALGEFDAAQTLALAATRERIPGQITSGLVDAFDVLYQVAKQRGDSRGALIWFEQYVAADKGYLSDVSARALAFQQVRQQVQQRKAQIAALTQQNQVLKLKRTVDARKLLAVRLGIALLMVVLASLGLYAYRTRRSQLKFRKLARRDGLTEIHNRQYFIECAEAELRYCRKSLREASLVAIDLDHFKQINDSHGHAAGDFALKAAVTACQRHLRSVDIFGRLGGEEFGILLPDTIPERAADIAEAMRAQIAALQGSPGGPEFPVTASFGIASARAAGYDLTLLLAHADSALYEAKRHGRDRVIRHGLSQAGPPPGIPERRQG